MKRKLNRRERVLLLLLGVGGVLWYLVSGEQRLGFGQDAAAPEALPPISGEPPKVNVELLAQGGVNYDPDGRNLFRYYEPPPPPPPKRVLPPPPPLPLPPPPAPVRQTGPREPTPPSPTFKYIGYLGPKEDRIAVFAEGEQQLLARVGEVVESEFLLLEFRYETVVFGFVDAKFKGKTTELKMVSQKGA